MQMRKSVSGCDDFDAAPSGIDLSSQFAVRGSGFRGSGFGVRGPERWEVRQLTLLYFSALTKVMRNKNFWYAPTRSVHEDRNNLCRNNFCRNILY